MDIIKQYTMIRESREILKDTNTRTKKRTLTDIRQNEKGSFQNANGRDQLRDFSTYKSQLRSVSGFYIVD
jgi:hypothetical protein